MMGKLNCPHNARGKGNIRRSCGDVDEGGLSIIASYAAKGAENILDSLPDDNAAYG